jgi:hypothetical protein
MEETERHLRENEAKSETGREDEECNRKLTVRLRM